MTCAKNYETKAAAVKSTWAKRADITLFMSDTKDNKLPAIGLNSLLGREHLSMKTMRAFQFVYEHHLNDADWFMKADDDTYVIVENLREMLSHHNASEPISFGAHFRKKNYYSGGSGYVLSKAALEIFGKRQHGVCVDDGPMEDMHMGICLKKLGVKFGNSRDASGKTRFFPFSPNRHVNNKIPEWYIWYGGYNSGVRTCICTVVATNCLSLL